jgi:EXLDI family protein
MPNKTIYVAEDDLSIFEQAQALAGDSISATIIQALRQFVERQEAIMQGYRTIDLAVGTITTSRKQFTGRLIAQAKQQHREGGAVLNKYEVYQTPKGNLVVYLKSIPAEGSYNQVEKRLDVYTSLDQLHANVPSELAEQVAQKLSGDQIEVLDI